MPSVSQADGSENLELAELRPSIQGAFEHVRTVKESQARLNAEARSCEHLVGMLEACLAATEEWDRLRSTLANHRSLPPLETRLGLALEAPTRSFEHEALIELTTQWGGDERHMLGRDALRVQVVKLKNRGECRIDGSRTEVESQVDSMFDRLVTANHGATQLGGGTREALLDFPAVLAALGVANRQHKEKEAQMILSLETAESESKSLQVAFAKAAAEHDMRAELQGDWPAPG